jgi:NADPH:quinone reductase
MSKVVRFYQTGGVENLKIENRELPTPQAGEVLVKIHASALNRAGLLYLQGAPINLSFLRCLGMKPLG